MSSADNDEAFDRVLQERVAALRREQVDRFDDDALAWMAVVPSWTERLAVACQFPSGDWSMKRFVEQATAAGLCVQHQTPNQGRLWQQIHVIVSIAPYLSEPV